MTQFVALLRGIGPTNPNMRNDKLGAAFASAGLSQVRPVIASGNIVFASSSRSTGALEKKIEQALKRKLGLSIDVIVRSQSDLEALLKRDPFQGAEHGKEWYLTVTFRKGKMQPVFSKIDRRKMDGPAFMADLEKRHGKRITTRTWNTVAKIVAKMNAAA